MKSRSILAPGLAFLAVGVFFSPARGAGGGNSFLAEPVGRCRVPPFREELRGAAAVFVGEVVRDEREGGRRTLDFEVEKFWKGAGAANVRVSVYETPRYQSWFAIGGKYLIFAAADEDGRLLVGRCSRSRETGQAAEDLQLLGKGRKPRG